MEVLHPRAQHHREIDVGRDGEEDRDGRGDRAPRQPAAPLEVDEDADHEREREDLLDDLEAPQDLAEDGSRAVARGDLAEDDRRREDDEQRPAHPEREREADQQRRQVQGAGV